MSQLSYLEKLLSGVKVEWKELGNSISFQRGKRLVKNQLQASGEYAVFQNSMTPLGYYHESNVSAKSAFVICAGAAGEIGFSDHSFWAADDVYYAEQSEALNSKYLYHFLLTKKYKIANQVRRASIPRLSKSAIEKLIIPIPCPDNPEKSLSIQAEIVRILDTFAAMTAELTAKLIAELNIRKKQYSYYRDNLLSFDKSDIEWKTLKEVCGFRNGFAFKSNLFKEIGLPIVRITNLNGSSVDLTNVKYFDPTDYKENTHSYSIVRGDILIAMSGATTGKLGFFDSTETAYLNQRVGKFVPDTDSLDNRYLYHFLLSNTEQIYVLAGGGAQPNLSSKVLMEKMLIPIPYANNPIESIFEQKRIADTLDKLDMSTKSITEDLSREIELRQKQYEYYRDLLLSFPKSDEAA